MPLFTTLSDVLPTLPDTGRNPLYLICDGETCERHGLPLPEFVRGAVAGGVRIIQYRHKNITATTFETNLLRLLPLCRDALLVVNDHAEIAERYRLWLHLGQEDTLPAKLTVPYGRSTHSLAELDDALSCEPQPAYVALGTMFASSTKPDVKTNRLLIAEYRKRTALPLVLIGGITLENVHELPQAGDIYYAVISDTFRFGASVEAIQKYVAAFKELFY